MDVRRSRHYVAALMEWLLILSALLNAATGAFAGTRAPDPAPQAATTVEAMAVAESAITVAAVAVRLVRPSVRAAFPAATAFPLRAERPLPHHTIGTDRLIE